jgi:hypothetical protein
MIQKKSRKPKRCQVHSHRQETNDSKQSVSDCNMWIAVRARFVDFPEQRNKETRDNTTYPADCISSSFSPLANDNGAWGGDNEGPLHFCPY